MMGRRCRRYTITITSTVVMIAIYFILSTFTFATVHGIYGSLKDIPGRPDKVYRQLGDMNIGAFFSISQYSTTTLCGTGIRFPLLQQYVEALKFAIDGVNNDTALLPNTTLGFITLDDCAKESTAVSQGLRFLPKVIKQSQEEEEEEKEEDNDSNGDRENQTHGSHAVVSSSSSSSEHIKDGSYDVIGVIGPMKSSNSIAVSYLLGPARVPQLSFLATSDELSHKEKHPYFLRVVPPDGYQMRAILEFILRQGWTYFSVVYSSGSYGETALSSIKTYCAIFRVCVATEHKLLPTTSDRQYRKVVTDLVNNRKARVVILVCGDSQMIKMFTAVHRVDAAGKLVWIGTDGWAERLSLLPSRYSQSMFGSFTTTFYAPTVPEFISYFKNLKPSQTKNPWFSEFWERQFDCRFADGTCDERKDLTKSDGFEFLSLTSYAMDSVYVYAHAVHRLLHDHCPGSAGKEARACVQGDVLMEYLRNVSFIGYTGNVVFDRVGNLLGKYVISQIRAGDPLVQVPVRTVDVMESYKMSDLNPIDWNVFSRPVDQGFGPNARFPKSRYWNNRDKSSPISVCSRLCEPGEQVVHMEQECCWECRACRENERLMLNRTRCERCPQFYWPDRSSNFTTCSPIPPHFPDTSEPYVILLIGLGVFGISLTLLVIAFYVINREARVIKASSRELSFLQLSAIVLGYMTMLVYVATPSPASCTAAFYMFCLSFNWLYAPLLVKTIRIFRIFDSGRKGTRPLTLVSPLSQVVLASSIILGQIFLCIVISFVSTPTSHLTHKILTEKYVELSCDLTAAGFSSFLAYNLTLVVLCSVFAFKTRKLPANFNESRFISMCVSTTLVIWLAFIPAYETSSRQHLRSLYLSLALLLNHSVALTFLFLTRLYAVYYVDDIVTSNTGAGLGVGGGATGGVVGSGVGASGVFRSHIGQAANHHHSHSRSNSMRSRTTRNSVMPATPTASSTIAGPAPIAVTVLSSNATLTSSSNNHLLAPPIPDSTISIVNIKQQSNV